MTFTANFLYLIFNLSRNATNSDTNYSNCKLNMLSYVSTIAYYNLKSIITT